MREIKFKGKDIKTKQWVKGDLRQVEGHTYIMDYDIGDNGVSDISRIFDIAYEVDPDTVGQYTGLHDKNGKEIYEGDVIKITYHKNDGAIKEYKKVIRHEFGMFTAGDFNSPISCSLFSYSTNVIKPEIEVIGNIYENPELLAANKSSE